MREKNETFQDKQKRLKKKRMLYQIKKEITSLEFKLTHPKLAKINSDFVKNLKISSKLLKKFTPYLVSAGVVYTGFACFDNKPFLCDDEWKNYADVMLEFDNTGNIRKEVIYDKESNDNLDNSWDNYNSRLYYYSKWEQSKDGFYTRNVQTYSIPKKTYDDIIKLFDQENLKLEDVLGSPILSIKESKNNLKDEELQEGAYIEAVIYNKDKNDYIIHKETVEENVLFSILFLFLSTILGRIASYFTNNYFPYDLSENIEKIKEEYQPLDEESLKKILEIKKDNYDRMMW